MNFVLTSFQLLGCSVWENKFYVMEHSFHLSLYFSPEVNVPVVGGHAGVTILPLFSQVAHAPFSYPLPLFILKFTCCMLISSLRIFPFGLFC